MVLLFVSFAARIFHRSSGGSTSSAGRSRRRPRRPTSAPARRRRSSTRGSCSPPRSKGSTPTSPIRILAHPFRAIAHNGEINALKGNLNALAAREGSLVSPLFGDELKKLLPVAHGGQSDSASLDNVFELLVAAGRDAPHAMMMLIPQAWGAKYHVGHDVRAFYEYHSALMEPWDGPAAVCFTDGTGLGAALDRNGLRPARWTLTKSGLFVLASETGVLDTTTG